MPPDLPLELRVMGLADPFAAPSALVEAADIVHVGFVEYLKTPWCSMCVLQLL